jgi:hypothetical protein
LGIIQITNIENKPITPHRKYKLEQHPSHALTYSTIEIKAFYGQDVTFNYKITEDSGNFGKLLVALQPYSNPNVADVLNYVSWVKHRRKLFLLLLSIL